MKKVLSIWFLTIYLCSTTQLGELLKFPILIEHFLEHRQESPDFSWNSFVDMHYLAQTVIDDDYARDMELPFKTMNTPLSISVSFTIPTVDYIFVVQPFVMISKGRQQQQIDALPSNYGNTIWQPPKYS